MDSSNNTLKQNKEDILDSDKWSDSILVKDENGKFGYLRHGQKPVEGDETYDDNIKSVVSEGDVAPKDAHFASVVTISGNSQSKADFAFHPDDKEEIESFSTSLPQDDSKKYSVEKIASKIIDKQAIKLDDKNYKIFTNILYNFFRSRKSAVITRELLSNSVLIAKKRLSSDKVDTILSIIKGIKNNIDSVGGLVVNQAELQAKAHIFAKKDKPIEDVNRNKVLATDAQQPDIELSEASNDAQAEIKEALGQLPQDILDEEANQDFPRLDDEDNNLNLAKKEEAKPLVLGEEEVEIDTVSDEESNKDLQEDKSKEEPDWEKERELTVKSQKTDKELPQTNFALPDDKVKEEDKETEVIALESKEKLKPAIEKEEVSLPKVSRPNMAEIGKKKLSDVQSPSQTEGAMHMPSPSTKSVLTGPVQELQSFDLIGFRRLGNSAEERADKVLDKIALLEQDSYTKKAQGISAWRSSPVYKFYLELGARSMSEGKDVNSLISELEQKGENTLSNEEFAAISDLNKKLRF